MKAHRVVRRRGSHIFLDRLLIDGGKIISLTRRPPFTLQKEYVLIFVCVSFFEICSSIPAFVYLFIG
jgi:hypothetical protein